MVRSVVSTQASRNASDAVSLVQTAEGALNEVHSMLQRVRELAVQYKNGTLSTNDRPLSSRRSTSSRHEIERIGTDTEFNGIKLLNARRHRSRSRSVRPTVSRSRVATISIGASGALGRVHALPRPRRRRTSQRSTTAINNVSAARATFGAVQNRLEHTISQPGLVPGEPDRFREPYPRRGHGHGDGQVHQAADPAAGRHVDAGAGEPGARRACCRSSARGGIANSPGIDSSRDGSANGRPSGRPFAFALPYSPAIRERAAAVPMDSW